MSPTHESVLYAGSSDGCINFWDQQNSCRYTHGGFLQGHKFAVLCLVTVENLLISGSEDSTIRIWKREKGGKGNNVHDCLAILEGHRGPIRCLNAVLQKDSFALSFLVYSASLDQTFKVWRVKKNQTLKDDDDNYHVMDDNKDNFHHHHTSPIVLSPSWVKNKLRSSSLKR
ncbi:Protein JINGUBANG [Bienertia sinuspersici]